MNENKIDQNGIFRKKFNISYSQIDSHYHLKPSSAMMMLQDVAVSHSNAAGFTLEKLKEKNLAWIIKGWHIDFYRPLMEMEDVFFSSWTKAYKKLQCDRDFVAVDKDNFEVIKATSRWFLMDTKKRKPKKVDNEFLKSYIPSERPSFFASLDYKLKDCSSLYEVIQDSLYIKNSHLDTNEHVNNISYISIALDYFDYEMLKSSFLYHIDALYISELTLGNKVQISIYKREIDDFSNEYIVNFHDDSYEKIYVSLSLFFKSNSIS